MAKGENDLLNVDLSNIGIDLSKQLEVEVAGEGSPGGYQLPPVKEEQSSEEDTSHEQKKEDEKNNLIEVETKDDKDPTEVGDNTTEETSTEDTEGDTSSTSSESPFNSIFTKFAALLQDEGVLSNFDQKSFENLSDEEQVNALIDHVDQEISESINGWVSSLPPQLQKAIVNYNEGVPIEEVIKIDSSRVRYSNLNEEDILKDENKMKKVIIDDRVSRGMPREEAEEEVANIVELEKAAKPAIKRLKTLGDKQEERSKALVKEREKEIKTQYNNYIRDVKHLVDSTEVIIPGIKLNKTVRSNLFNQMTVPVGTDEYGRPYTEINAARSADPMRFDMVVNYLYNVSKGFKDWSKFVNTANTNATKNFIDSLESTKSTKTKGRALEGTKKDEDSIRKNLLDSIKSFT